MPKKRKVEITTDFLYAHGIRVSLSTFEEMVLEAVGRMRRMQDQPTLSDLTGDEIAALKHDDMR